MIDTESNRVLLQSLLDTYEISLGDDEARLALKHLDLVVEKNKVMNLTRIVEPCDAIVRHVVDSLLFLPAVSNSLDAARGNFVDIGTGGGFPGIPLCIVTGAQGLLIDSVGKKVAAVNEFIHALELENCLCAQQIRAEELARTRHESFDVVVARAVADLGALVEYASPLLMTRGMLVVSKARISDDELSRGNAVAALVGMRRVSRETYELPYEMGHREILSYEKIGKSSVRLPRNVGMALHKPLA